MFTEEIRDKYLNHHAKSLEYNAKLLPQFYDQYIAMFTAFNILYSVIPSILGKNGIALLAPETDNQMATVLVAQYLTEQRLMVAFEENKSADIQSIISVIENKIFNIKLDRSGNALPQLDQQILAGFKSDQNSGRCLAILKTIYFVRCNMVHGHKDIQEYQRLLLEPLSGLLATLNNCFFSELNLSLQPSTVN